MANQVLEIQKVVGALPTTLSPNTFYAVRVGVGYDLYLSDSTGAVAHRLNPSDDRMRLYVQSRGTGLVSNGTGLMGDTTNFSKFTFDPTEAKVGMGCFVCDMANADFAIDELIPVSPLDSYKVEFFAKYGKGSPQGHTYFYVSAYDADGQPMTPHWITDSTYKVERMVQGENQIIIHADDRQKFYDRFVKNTSATIRFLSPNYTAQTGYLYPPNTYSRTQLASTRTYAQMSYNKDTGVLSNVPIQIGVEPNTLVSISVTGENYAYIVNEMRNSKLSEEWQHFAKTFSTSQIMENPSHIQNKIFPYASFIKIGWLLNRGVTGGVTKVSGVQMRQV